MFADNALRTENTAAHTAQQYVVTMTAMFAMEARQHLQLWKHMGDNRRFALEAGRGPATDVSRILESRAEGANQYVQADTGNFAPYMTVHGALGQLNAVPEAKVLQGPPGHGNDGGHAMHQRGGRGGGAYMPPRAHGGNDQDLHLQMPTHI